VVNRQAVIIKPKKAYLDWINETDEDGDEYHTADEHENTVYLLPESENYKEAIDILKGKCKEIIENELLSWIIDKQCWPDQLNWKRFNEWFSYEILCLVYDTASKSLEREFH